ncbi:hypothetical protein GJV07_02115 [Enterobacteriaceae bacterium RIT711]|nr:hypothetical protein [Enterobacteriaceae bacterium RIT711]
MKKIIIAFTGVAFACALSACSSPELKAQQKTERQVLETKQQADRQVERADKSLVLSVASTAAATANLTAKKQAQVDADAALQQQLCPQPAPAE